MSDLYNQLRDLRKRLAEQEGVEVFRVFQNATIDEICETKPKNAEELLEVKGMGEKKVGKYGKAILQIVNQESGIMNQGKDGEEISNSSATAKAMADRQYPISNESQMLGSGLTSQSLAQGDESQKQKVTVSEYLDYLNLVLGKTADIKIVGEVSGSKMYPSGFYFTLKDKTDESTLSCYLPTYTYRGLGVPLEDGMEVSVEGMPRMVKRNGRFQFAVENVELVGEGALKKAYDLLKAKLEDEGLFARKRELPEFISSVGVITSRAGAVIHDFRNNLAKLGIKVYLKDVRVEGASSVGMVVSALKWFNNLETLSVQSTGHLPQRGRINAPDVIVIMRGGGSMEDLQGFNSEAVVRAVFGSRVPTIISIGHDKDVPLAQLAADVMVSTPTAAAHAVSASWNRLVEDLPQLQNNLTYNFSSSLQVIESSFSLQTQTLFNWSSRLGQSYKITRGILAAQIDRHVEWIHLQRIGLIGQIGRIRQIQTSTQERVRVAVETAASFLEQVNPERQLRLGYSIVKNKKGSVVRSVQDVVKGEQLLTRVEDGTINSVVN